MVKNQRGNAVVLVVVIAIILAIIGLGFWIIFSSKKQSSQLLKDRNTVRQYPKKSEQQ